MDIFDPATVGGILLIIASFFMMRGELLRATIFFIFADACWILLAYTTENIFGIITVVIGAFANLIVAVKINSGVFVSDLKNNQNRQMI